MVQRSKKLAFVKIDDDISAEYERLTGFTEFTVNSNPREYTRKYIDEDMERSAVISYQPTISYKFDYDADNPAQGVIMSATELELTGEDAVCGIAIVDISREEDGGFFTTIRDFCIIPDVAGDDPDTYTYSGKLKATGEKSFGIATSDDGWKTMRVRMVE